MKVKFYNSSFPTFPKEALPLSGDLLEKIGVTRLFKKYPSLFEFIRFEEGEGGKKSLCCFGFYTFLKSNLCQDIVLLLEEFNAQVESHLSFEIIYLEQLEIKALFLNDFTNLEFEVLDQKIDFTNDQVENHFNLFVNDCLKIGLKEIAARRFIQEFIGFDFSNYFLKIINPFEKIKQYTHDQQKVFLDFFKNEKQKIFQNIGNNYFLSSSQFFEVSSFAKKSLNEERKLVKTFQEIQNELHTTQGENENGIFLKRLNPHHLKSLFENIDKNESWFLAYELEKENISKFIDDLWLLNKNKSLRLKRSHSRKRKTNVSIMILLSVFTLISSIFFIQSESDKTEAERQQKLAKEAEKLAKANAEEAITQKLFAEENEKIANLQKNKSDSLVIVADIRRKEAERAKRIAIVAQKATRKLLSITNEKADSIQTQKQSIEAQASKIKENLRNIKISLAGEVLESKLRIIQNRLENTSTNNHELDSLKKETRNAFENYKVRLSDFMSESEINSKIRSTLFDKTGFSTLMTLDIIDAELNRKKIEKFSEMNLKNCILEKIFLQKEESLGLVTNRYSGLSAIVNLDKGKFSRYGIEFLEPFVSNISISENFIFFSSNEFFGHFDISSGKLTKYNVDILNTDFLLGNKKWRRVVLDQEKQLNYNKNELLITSTKDKGYQKISNRIQVSGELVSVLRLQNKFYVSMDNILFKLTYDEAKNNLSLKQVKKFNAPISIMNKSKSLHHQIILGFQNGDILAFDPEKKKINFHTMSKVHRTKVSGVNLIQLDKSKFLLVTAGYDNKLNVYFSNTIEGIFSGQNIPMYSRSFDFWVDNLIHSGNGSFFSNAGKLQELKQICLNPIEIFNALSSKEQ